MPVPSNDVNQKQHIRNEGPTLENKNTTLPSDPEETLSQEQKTNVENVKRIMKSEKTKLPSLRNIVWRTLKTETNKINQILPYISTNNITELNELIYAGAKLVCEKIGIPSIITKKQSKLGWEIRQETQIKKIYENGPKWVKQKDPGICGNRMEKTTRENITVQLEEKTQKVLEKEGRLKRYRQRVKQYKQNKTFQNNERNFYLQLGGHDIRTYQQLDAKETKIWQPKRRNERADWINNKTRELEGLEEGSKREIHIELLKKTLRKISNWKTPGHDGIHGF